MKIHYCVDPEFHNRKTDCGRRYHVEAVAKITDVVVCHKPVNDADIVWYYSGGYPKTIEWVAKSDKPKITCVHDAYTDKHGREAQRFQADAVVFHHHMELDNWPWLNVLRYHIPQSVERTVFYREEYGERTTNVLLCGYVDRDIYPQRYRVKQLIESGRIPGRIREHPGYRTRGWDETKRQYEDYAKDLRSARIAFVGSSKYRIPVQKFVECIAAKCVVLSDLPRDTHWINRIGKWVIDIGQKTDADLVAMVRWMLCNPAALEDHANQAAEEYLSGYTCEHYAEQFVRIAKDVIDRKKSRA